MRLSDRSPSLSRCGALVALLLGLALTSPTAAQPSAVGQVKKVSGQAFFLRDAGRIPAGLGDSVFEKDVIETGADGAIGITFIDNTVMSGGPNSQIVLEDYKFNSSNFKGSMLNDMNRGTISMISGDIARSTPGAMKVKTPTAILGVRGTRFVIEVKDNR